jgi:hypothetical protein
LRRILREDHPRFPQHREAGPDTNAEPFPGADPFPVETCLEAFRGAVEANAALLRVLDENAWQRWFWQGEDSRYTLEDWLLRMAQHADEHAAQLLRAAGRTSD